MVVKNTPNTSLGRDGSESPTSTTIQNLFNPLDSTTSDDSGMDSTMNSTILITPRSPINRVQPVIRNVAATQTVDNNNNNKNNGQASANAVPPTPPNNNTESGTAQIHICHWHGDCYINVPPSGVPSMGAILGFPTARIIQQQQQNQQQRQ